MSKIKIIIITIFVILFSVNSFVFADVGNINRYDGSDFGGSFDFDSSFDFDDFDSDFNLSGFPIEYIIGIVIVIAIVSMSKGKTSNNSNTNSGTSANQFSNRNSVTTSSYNPARTAMIAKKIRETDEAFSEDNFLTWAGNIFVKLQTAWTARDFEIIRTFESEELFEEHQTQLKQYIDTNRINVIDRVNVKSTSLSNHSFDGDKEILEVNLDAVMKDYIIDATTKELLEGDKTRDWHMKYVLMFARKKGVTTKVGTDEVATTNCPNCGAPTAITSSGKCEYCGSVITTGEHDWVLISIKGRK